LSSARVAGRHIRGGSGASAQFDSSDGVPPRLYASPLYTLDRISIAYGKYPSRPFSVVIAATSTGFRFYCRETRSTDEPALRRARYSGRKQLGMPCKDGF